MRSILIIGGGNMGAALASRWRKAFTHIPISVIEPSAAKRKALSAQGIKTYGAIAGYKSATDVLVLAVKPQSSAEVIKQIRAQKLKPNLLISIMAGIPIAKLKAVGAPVVRVMPNTPALIGEGMSVLCAPKLPMKLRQGAETLFKAVGEVAWVERENDLHAVTAISGSGPAYLFAFMEAMMRSAEALGLNKALANQLVTETIKGAAMLAAAKHGDVTNLRKQVTSPKGTTEAALKILQKKGLGTLVKATVKAAEKRSKQLVN